MEVAAGPGYNSTNVSSSGSSSAAAADAAARQCPSAYHQSQAPGTGLANMWVKAVTSWVMCLVYGWTLLAPSLFPDRDFGRPPSNPRLQS